MKKRLFFLLCVVVLISCTLTAFAANKVGKQAANNLLSMELLAVQEAGLLDKQLLGDDLEKPASQLAAVSMLVRMSGADLSKVKPVKLPGVPEKEAQEVAYAISKGWVDGGSFQAGTPIKADEWFTMVLRLLGFGPGDFKADKAAMFAQHIGLVKRLFKGTMTGADLAESAYNTLRFEYRDGTGPVVSKLVLEGKCTDAAFNILGLYGRDLSAGEVSERCMAAAFALNLYESGGAGATDEPDGWASGFFLTPDGVAATCLHSIQGYAKGIATLSTGEQYEVSSVLWTDPKADLALLRINRTSLEGEQASMFAYLEIDESSTASPGGMAYAIGNPMGLGLCITQGSICSVGVKLERYSVPCIVSTPTIAFGSGGGALLNTAGHVIGVTSGAFQWGNEMYLAIQADALAAAVKGAGGGGASLSSLGKPDPKTKERTIEFEGQGECEAECQGVEVKGEVTGSGEKKHKVDGKVNVKVNGKIKISGKFVVTEEHDLREVVDY